MKVYHSVPRSPICAYYSKSLATLKYSQLKRNDKEKRMTNKKKPIALIVDGSVDMGRVATARLSARQLDFFITLTLN